MRNAKLPTLLARTSVPALCFGVAASALPQHDSPPPEVVLEVGQVVGEPMGLVPRPTTSFGAVEHDGWMYVLGGYFGRPHDYVVEHQSRDFYRVNLHDPKQIQWLPNDGRIQSLTLEAYSGGLVRAGGMVVVPTGENETELTSVADVQRFDPSTAEWSDLPSLPAPRSSHDSVVVDDVLYVLGGWRLGHEDYPHWYDDVWRLDLADESAVWEKLPASFQRRAIGAAHVEGKLVAIGGIHAEQGLSSEVEVLDLATNTWSKGPEFPGTAFGAASIGIDGRVYVSAVEGIVHSWKPGDAKWERTGQFVFPRFFHQFVEHPAGGLVAVGGIGREGRVRHLERLRIDGTDAERLVSWKVPCPDGSKNRQGLFVREGTLYVFGGSTIRSGHDFGPEDFTGASFQLNLAKLEVEDLPPFPSTRQTVMASVVDGGSVGLAMGGFGHDGEVTRTFADSYTFDFREESWAKDTLEFPQSVAQFGMAEYDGSMWVFGGYNVDPENTERGGLRVLSDVLREERNGEARRLVDTGIDMPTERRGFGSAQLGSKFYVVGGVLPGFRAAEACEIFDFETQEWSEFPKPSHARISPELVAFEGKLYLAGGLSETEDGFEANTTVECFDPLTEEWSTVLTDLPVEHGYLNLRAFRGHLLFFSTNAEDAQIAEVALYRPAAE